MLFQWNKVYKALLEKQSKCRTSPTFLNILHYLNVTRAGEFLFWKATTAVVLVALPDITLPWQVVSCIPLCYRTLLVVLGRKYLMLTGLWLQIATDLIEIASVSKWIPHSNQETTINAELWPFDGPTMRFRFVLMKVMCYWGRVVVFSLNPLVFFQIVLFQIKSSNRSYFVVIHTPLLFIFSHMVIAETLPSLWYVIQVMKYKMGMLWFATAIRKIIVWK